MARAPLRSLLVALALLASRAEAAITIELRVDAEVRRDVAVHVSAKNVGDEPAEHVSPDARLLDGTAHAEREVALRPGFVESWDMTLPRPAALGTFPLVVVLAYADAFGRRMSVPAVHQVRTAATTPSDVAITLEPPRLVTAATATVQIANHETTSIAGTLATVASGDLAVEPVTRAIALEAGGTLAVPLRVENRSALPGSTAALWVYATLDRGGWTDTAIASGTVPIGDPSATPASPRIALALGVIGAAAALVWGLRRWLAPSAAPRSRADRRRAR